MRKFIELSYRGAPYFGWQRQPSQVSVQQTIEDALGRLLRRDVAIVGAGRTDTGVNARQMYAHFDADELIVGDDCFLRSLNALVGNDIAIKRILDVRDDAHARFDAVSRTYRYFVHTEKSPFVYPLSWKTPAKFNFDRMNEAAKLLVETTDFTSFAKLHSDAKTNICHVTNAQWVEMSDSQYFFEITADRFLRNMVRAVVGTLADVGREKLSVNDFKDIIEQRNRCSAGTSMPPHPLFLWEVRYPYIR